MKPKWRMMPRSRRWVWTPGLAGLPYRSALIVDCKRWPTNTPLAGPSGCFPGAPRKKLYKDSQEAVYTGYENMHGMKLEACFMPNGLCTVFGPVAVSKHDSKGPDSLLAMSNLPLFLRYIQLGRPELTPPYGAFGDGLYNINSDTVRTYYRAYFAPHIITLSMLVCDEEMQGCRETLEWDFGKTGKIFKICTDPDNFKLGKQNPVSLYFVYSIEIMSCELLIT